MESLIIVSGRSGSGKSSALNILEDFGYYCIDNLPLAMLPALVNHCQGLPGIDRIGLGIDVRTHQNGLGQLEGILKDLEQHHIRTDILFMDARDDVLLQRFNATRRRHPLTFSPQPVSLMQALEQERKLLDPIISLASVYLDTSDLNIHQLNRALANRLSGAKKLNILIESFGYKHGVPLDADFVFDVRSLPNPHWLPELREFTGFDENIRNYLNGTPVTEKMFASITDFMMTWLPVLSGDERHYLTIAIGCTGGRHRSVYMVERFAALLRSRSYNVNIFHRELNVSS